MDRGIDDPALAFARTTPRPIVEGKRADDTTVARLDRARPAGGKPERPNQGPIVGPERIRPDVGDLYRLAAIGGGAAGAGGRSDRNTVDRLRIGLRKAWREIGRASC